MVAREVPAPAAARFPRARHLRRLQLELADGATTTLHVAAHRAERTDVEVIRLRRRAPLEAWCAAHDVREALVGGFYVRPSGRPLGELRTRGMARAHEPFIAPWDAERACLHSEHGTVRIGPRSAFAATPGGDLLQAGPLLVRDGTALPLDGIDPEGFSAGAVQFDSDITAGRYPRAALGLAPGRLLAVACDGRAEGDAGLTLSELAQALVALGATAALNLDGGGSTSLVCAGRLRNHPRERHGIAIPGGRAISTALVFAPRA